MGKGFLALAIFAFGISCGSVIGYVIGTQDDREVEFHDPC